jgi:hypothetical protein
MGRRGARRREEDCTGLKSSPWRLIRAYPTKPYTNLGGCGVHRLIVSQRQRPKQPLDLQMIQMTLSLLLSSIFALRNIMTLPILMQSLPEAWARLAPTRRRCSRRTTPMSVRQTSPLRRPEAAASELYASTRPVNAARFDWFICRLHDIEMHLCGLFKSDHVAKQLGTYFGRLRLAGEIGPLPIVQSTLSSVVSGQATSASTKFVLK